MLLNDIGKSPDATFRRINQYLETNFGFKISEDVSDRDLVSIMDHIEEEITDLKVRGDDAKGSLEISKRLLVLEGIKNLREFAITQLKSPKLDIVINNLVDYVVNTFEITGKDLADFERAVERAMDEYRSSRYRFPDDFIEQRVRHDAMSRIQSDAAIIDSSIMEDDQTDETDEAKCDSEMNSIDEDIWDYHIPDTPEAKKAMKILDNPTLELVPKQGSDEQIPMIRNPNTGHIIPDPFAVHAAERKKGQVMKEHTNLVKNLRYLLETEVSQAEVMMAAKGFAQELQDMVEKIGRLQNEDLPPVTDQMRETYGMESASAFQTKIYGALQSVMDSLYTAKQQVDDAVSDMALTGRVNAETDMDVPIDANMTDTNADMNTDLDNIVGSLDSKDEFGGEEALGRAKKMESVLHNKVMEMKKLVAKAKKIKEAKK